MIRHIKKAARVIGLKSLFKTIENTVLKLRGYNLIGLEPTTAFMTPYEIKSIAGNKALLPLIPNCNDESVIIFPKKESNTDKVYVWEYRNDKKPARLSKYGSVIIGNKVLCTDWNQSSFYKDIWKTDKREKKIVPAAIALFSQFQDGIMYGGYYDFIFLVATKLSRIKDAYPNEDLTHLPIVYPLFNAPYEAEYLELLGFEPENLIDSTKYKITAQRLITGNSAHWHPNLADLLSLKKNIQKQFNPSKNEYNRIYISRKGRRCITNEDELIALLKKFNFVIIEDKKRTVREQMTIYRNAEFIIGPHGASFSNIIWCEPGTHLMELFSPNYAPDFFLYLAKMMDMEYSAYYNDLPDSNIDYLVGLVEDIQVSIPKLEACLENIFAKKTKS
jgi:hypothetical protein